MFHRFQFTDEPQDHLLFLGVSLQVKISLTKSIKSLNFTLFSLPSFQLGYFSIQMQK